MDFSGYSMFIPHPNDFPHLSDLLGRVLMIKGPSLPFTFRSARFYHRQKKVKCNKTEEAHERLEGQMEAQSARAFKYHLIIFPPDVVLDNSILSDDNFDVKKHLNGTFLADSDSEFANPLGRKLNFMAVWWQIVEGAGEKVGKSPVTGAHIDPSLLLD